jgi:4-amino-4-deoxychorismate synthase (2-amino-4-deoxychorismate-forming) component I
MNVRELGLAPAALFATLRARAPQRYPVWLDSALTGALGRTSILAACPQQQLVLWGDGQLSGPGAGAAAGFTAALDQWWQQLATPADPAAAALPFRGGWMLYLSYELARELEPGLGLPPAAAATPVAVAMRVPAALLREEASGRLLALAEPGFEALLDTLAADCAVHRNDAGGRMPLAGVRITEDPPQRFERAVALAHEHIAAGDIYQANLSRRWQVEFESPPDPAALYAQLRRANPAPFAAWADLPALTLFSSSPERLVQVQAGRIETRPIAGTRLRSRLEGADGAEQASLLANPKERAEHVMLIDLERNDLGRICQPGSVEVSEFMVTESYEHVHHIVSGVRGQLRPGLAPGAVLRALFPGGTITGCPKYRSMQIIGALEGEPRGAYTGSLGYLNRDGSMDLNILIRTMSWCAGALEFRAGAGIVADSNFTRELEETRAKARGLLRAFDAPLVMA